MDRNKDTQASLSDLPPADDDPRAADRKRDHIELAFQSQVTDRELDDRFYYEPMLSGHPEPGSLRPLRFAGKTLRAPIWVSSMTGGTEWARHINRNLARACHDFGMGMGLGSCRALLNSDEYLADFDVRDLIGDGLPLYANLGIAQLEYLAEAGDLHKAGVVVDKLRADGLIVHVNPLQEWLQPEGDRYRHPPVQTIERLLEKATYPVIVKEVGQGMGIDSLRALLALPLAAVDFAAHGGTNFARLEMLRNDPAKRAVYEQLAFLGHNAAEMVDLTNQLVAEMGDERACQQIIVSGGIKHFLDGFYLIRRATLPAVYGQASAFLKHARSDYDTLARHIEGQVRGLELAQAFLKCKTRDAG